MDRLQYDLGIPVRNEASNIRGVIESALEQTNPPNRIIICINGSTDGTETVLRDMQSSVSNLVLLESPPGKANAWNQISLEARGEIVVFCDGDIRFGNQNTLESLTAHIQSSANILLGGSVIQLPSKRTVPYRLKSPSGQLYAMKRELIDRVKDAYGKMPINIINEDLFLTLLAFPHVEVTEDAFFYCNKPSIGDIIHTQLRIIKGIRQLRDMGLSKELDNLLEWLYQSDDAYKKRLKYRLILLLSRLLRVQEGDSVWREARSTKKPINFNQVR